MTKTQKHAPRLLWVGGALATTLFAAGGCTSDPDAVMAMNPASQSTGGDVSGAPDTGGQPAAGGTVDGAGGAWAGAGSGGTSPATGGEATAASGGDQAGSMSTGGDVVDESDAGPMVEEPDQEPEPLPSCTSNSTEPCGTFTTSSDIEITLGPYGVVMMPNMGEGFESAIASGDSDNNVSCTNFTRLFGGDAADSTELLDIAGLDMALYAVYRPARWSEGETFPLITWGNGTCAKVEGYGALLRYVASQGYIVVAANSRWVGGNDAMTNAIDYMFAANADPESPFYQRVDTDKVGAMGHSQGAGATATAAKDKRIKSVILWNGGSATDQPRLVVTGDRDIGSPTASSVAGSTLQADHAAYLFYHMVPMRGSGDGHLTLMTEPERVIDPAVQWFDLTLKKTPEAPEWFLGDDCRLCNRDAEFEYGQVGLDTLP